MPSRGTNKLRTAGVHARRVYVSAAAGVYQVEYLRFTIRGLLLKQMSLRV